MDLTREDLSPIIGRLGSRRVWLFPDGSVLPVVSGGDGPPEPPALPEDLAAAADEDLGALEASLLEFFATNRGGATDAAVMAALSECAARVEAVRAEAHRRLEAAGTTTDALAELDRRLAGEPGTDFAASHAPFTGAHAHDHSDGAGASHGHEHDHEDDADHGHDHAGVQTSAAAGTSPAAQTPPAGQVVVQGISREDAAAIAGETARAILASMGPVPGPTGPGGIRALVRYRPEAAAPVPEEQRSGLFRATVTAAADLPSLSFSSEIPDARTLSELMSERWNIDQGKAATGAGERITIAHVAAHVDDDALRLDRDAGRNAEKIAAVMEQRSLVAAGGLCAPVQPLYDQPVISEAIRPFRSGLTTFVADRGGVRLVPVPLITDAAITAPGGGANNTGPGVGVITVAQDQAGAPLKTCLDIPCKASVEYDVAAIYRCLQFANLGARVFPEQVDTFNQLVLALQAQLAEQQLIGAVNAVSNQLTMKKTFGTARQLLAQLDHAAAQMRNAHRMDPATVLQVRIPAWALNAMRADLTSSFHDDPELLSAADAVLEAFFVDRHLAVGYYVDSSTGLGQTFANVGANGTAVPDYPSTLVSFMFPEGAFLFLDGGTLDIGIVRDSTLVAGNRFRDFAESWEGLAFTGLPSYAVTHTVSADGSYGAAIAIAAAAASGL